MIFNTYRYRYNKNANVGMRCYCPLCGGMFVKKKWNQIFDKRACATKYQSMKECEGDYTPDADELAESIITSIGNVLSELLC